MGTTQKGIGCVALILLVIVIAFIFTKNNPEAPPGNPDSAPGLTNSADTPGESPQLPGLEGLITEPEPTTSLASTMSTLSGIYRLNLSAEELVQLDDRLSEYGSSESAWAGSGTVGAALNQPVTIDRYNGESLVVLGSEWSGRSQTQQAGMNIEFYPAALLGYGNRSMLEDVDVEDIEAISGISISTVSKDPDDLSAALKGTGIKFLHCKLKTGNQYDDHYHILADRYEQAMSYRILDGTEYIDTGVTMNNPYFAYREDTPVAVPVQVTAEGYYAIDISSLPSGYYVIDGLMGNYAIIII